MSIAETFLQYTAGRDEPVLDADLPIIDAHVHLFDRPPLRFLLDDYLAQAGAGHNIVGSVHVETQVFPRPDGPEVLRPLGEVEFANGVAAMAASGTYGPCRVAAAIVGYADLRHGDAVAELLDRQLAAAPDRFRGIRQVCVEHPTEAPYRLMTTRPPAGLLHHDGFRRGYAQLVRRGLSFDAAVFHHQLPALAALADEHPDGTIVLNHAGMAMAMDLGEGERREVFDRWRRDLADLARRPNVTCKVGGFGLPFWGFGFDQRRDPVGSLELAAVWRPYVETALEAFGVDRCLMESDYPMDARSAGFVPLWNALKLIVAGASPAEKAALFHDTAARVYRIAPSAPPAA